MKMAKKYEQTPSPSASVVDGKLIISLPDAYTPVVWQMDLEQAKSSALEVREETKNNRFTLTLKAQNGETRDIASYEERKNAVKALMVTAQALESAHGKIRPQSTFANTNAEYASVTQGRGQLNSAEYTPGGNKAGAFLATAMIILLVIAWTFSIPKSADIISSGRTSTSNKSETGTPVSADDFLSGR